MGSYCHIHLCLCRFSGQTDNFKISPSDPLQGFSPAENRRGAIPIEYTGSPSILCRDLSDVWFVVLEWELTYSEISFFNCLLRVVTDTNFKANGQKLMKLEQFEFSTSPLRFSAGIAFALPFEGTVSQSYPSILCRDVKKSTFAILVRLPWNLTHTQMYLSVWIVWNFKANGLELMTLEHFEVFTHSIQRHLPLPYHSKGGSLRMTQYLGLKYGFSGPKFLIFNSAGWKSIQT